MQATLTEPTTVVERSPMKTQPMNRFLQKLRCTSPAQQDGIADRELLACYAGNLLAAGKDLTNVVSLKTITLMKGTIRNMKLTQIKNFVIVTAVAGLFTLALGALLQQTFAGFDEPPAKQATTTKSASQKNNEGGKKQSQPLPKPEPWTGFLSNATLSKLPNPVKVNNNHPFKIGVIQDAKTFNDESAGAVISAKGQKEVLPRWSKEID
jgi:hypothetical protein